MAGMERRLEPGQGVGTWASFGSRQASSTFSRSASDSSCTSATTTRTLAPRQRARWPRQRRGCRGRATPTARAWSGVSNGAARACRGAGGRGNRQEGHTRRSSGPVVGSSSRGTRAILASAAREHGQQAGQQLLQLRRRSVERGRQRQKQLAQVNSLGSETQEVSTKFAQTLVCSIIARATWGCSVSISRRNLWVQARMARVQ
jgi:hypothetical protein